MSNAMTRTGLTANVTLYSEQSTNPQSQFFRIGDRPITISAVNLAEDDVITFYVVKVAANQKITSDCRCTFDIPQPAIIGEQLLMCPECVDEVGFVPVRLTANNPVVVLKHPHESVLQANYEGEGLGESTVSFVVGAIDSNITPGMSGCPQVCCEDMTWTDTGSIRCNIQTGQVEEQQVSNCGRVQWIATGPLNWQDTGDFRCNAAAGTKEKKQVNDCGNARWIADGALTWVDTGVTRCNLATNSQSHQEVNECGNLRWVSDGQIVWTPTGDTRCRNSRVQNEQTNACGGIRWVTTTEACSGDDDQDSFIASYPIPGTCGWAYRPGDPIDPAATVQLENCDGAGLALWIYPTPNTYPLATIPVYDCMGADCPPGSEALGYARNAGPAGMDKCDATTNVNITGAKPYVVQVYRTAQYLNMVWSNGKETRKYDPQYCASLPIVDGFAYRYGDLRDPEATVRVEPEEDAEGNPIGQLFYMYPSPRINATIPYTKGEQSGFLCNFSNCYGRGATGGDSGIVLIDTFGQDIPGEQ